MMALILFVICFGSIKHWRIKMFTRESGLYAVICAVFAVLHWGCPFIARADYMREEK